MDIIVQDRKYTIISMPAVNGTIIPSDTAIIEPETDTTYAIVPNIGYHTDSILVDGVKVSDNSVYTFTNVLANHTIQAYFSINIYRIIKAATAGGYISDIGGTPAKDTNWLQHGAPYEINATAFSSYQFSNWAGVASDIAAMNYKLQDSAKCYLNLRAEFVRATMVLIPAKDSTFSMGKADVIDPVHNVTFTYNYWMDATEVTQGDYFALTGLLPSANTGVANLPVENVSYYDAVLYCNKRSAIEGLDTVYSYSQKLYMSFACTSLVDFQIHYDHNGYRLSTEAEWEYACRGGTTTPYYWGTDSAAGTALSWNIYSSSGKTQPVKHVNTINPFGLYDMAGNVWEKCNDWVADYPATSQTNPVGPSTATGTRIARGGAYLNGMVNLQSAGRGWNVPGAIYVFIGFRVARPQLNPY